MLGGGRVVVQKGVSEGLAVEVGAHILFFEGCFWFCDIPAADGYAFAFGSTYTTVTGLDHIFVVALCSVSSSTKPRFLFVLEI